MPALFLLHNTAELNSCVLIVKVGIQSNLRSRCSGNSVRLRHTSLFVASGAAAIIDASIGAGYLSCLPGKNCIPTTNRSLENSFASLTLGKQTV